MVSCRHFTYVSRRRHVDSLRCFVGANSIQRAVLLTITTTHQPATDLGHLVILGPGEEGQGAAKQRQGCQGQQP